MAILVTNDDGIDSPGLRELAYSLDRAGHALVIVAPQRNMSGAGASVGYLGQGSRIGVQQTEVPGLSGSPAFAVDGPPGLIVLLARLGAFGDDIDLVASGVNPGWNTGRSVLHSGTIGAALTASGGGWSAVAVSTDELRPGAEPNWRTAADLAAEVVEWLVDEPAATVVNLNVPDVDRGDIKGVRWAELAPSPAVQTGVVSAGDGYIELAWQVTRDPVPGHTDTGLVQAGYASVTVLESVREAERRSVDTFLESRLPARSGAGASTAPG